jgi:hypothetical protein
VFVCHFLFAQSVNESEDDSQGDKEEESGSGVIDVNEEDLVQFQPITNQKHICPLLIAAATRGNGNKLANFPLLNLL